MTSKLEKIDIRTEYQPGDIGLITKMHGELYNFGRHFEAYVAETLGHFYLQMDQARERVWVVEDNGKLIGTIALKDTKGVAQLRYFLLDPAYRGMGLGKMLMDAFMDFMNQVGYTSSFLLTEKSLLPAANLYKKYGYKYISSSVTNFGLEEMRYELTL